MNMITKKKHPRIQYKEHTQIFKLLSHPARLAILEILQHGEECVCHMEAVLGYRQAYLSQQLSVLREAGIIQDRRDGWNIFYRVVEPDIYAVIESAHRMASPEELPGERLSQPDCPCPKCAPMQKTD